MRRSPRCVSSKATCTSAASPTIASGESAWLPRRDDVAADGQPSLVFDRADGEPIRCPTAIVVGAEGELYVTDGSNRHPAADWVWDLMERRSQGRLVRFDRRRSEARVLQAGLAFPSGVAAAKDGTSLLVAQAWTRRLDRFALDGRRPRTIFGIH